MTNEVEESLSAFWRQRRSTDRPIALRDLQEQLTFMARGILHDPQVTVAWNASLVPEGAGENKVIILDSAPVDGIRDGQSIPDERVDHLVGDTIYRANLAKLEQRVSAYKQAEDTATIWEQDRNMFGETRMPAWYEKGKYDNKRILSVLKNLRAYYTSRNTTPAVRQYMQTARLGKRDRIIETGVVDELNRRCSLPTVAREDVLDLFALFLTHDIPLDENVNLDIIEPFEKAMQAANNIAIRDAATSNMLLQTVQSIGKLFDTFPKRADIPPPPQESDGGDEDEDEQEGDEEQDGSGESNPDGTDKENEDEEPEGGPDDETEPDSDEDVSDGSDPDTGDEEEPNGDSEDSPNSEEDSDEEQESSGDDSPDADSSEDQQDSEEGDSPEDSSGGGEESASATPGSSDEPSSGGQDGTADGEPSQDGESGEMEPTEGESDNQVDDDDDDFDDEDDLDDFEDEADQEQESDESLLDDNRPILDRVSHLSEISQSEADEIQESIEVAKEDLTEELTSLIGGAGSTSCIWQKGKYNAEQERVLRTKGYSQASGITQILQRFSRLRSRTEHGTLDGYKIDSRRVGRVTYGNMHVFQKRTIIDKLNMCLVILKDSSGSIDDSKFRIMQEVGASFVQAFNGRDDVELIDMSYTTGGSTVGRIHKYGTMLYRHFDPRLGGKYLTERMGSGGTPSGIALAAVRDSIFGRLGTTKKDRVIIHLTDGAPDDQAEVANQVKLNSEAGITTYCLLVGTTYDPLTAPRYMKQFYEEFEQAYEGRFATVASFNDLLPALTQLFQNLVEKR